VELLGGGVFSIVGECGDAGCGTVKVGATRVVLEATFEGQAAPVWVVVDSGASGVFMDDGFLATLGDGARRPRLDGAVFGTVAGAVGGTHSRVWRLGLGAGATPVTVEDVAVIVAPGLTILDSVSAEVGRPVRALIGGTYLRHFLATLDYQAGELRLSRYDAPTHVAADEWIGVGMSFAREGDDWLAREVFTDRDAYVKGLRRGDVIEELGGVPLRGQPGELLDATLGGFGLGDEVDVAYRRGVSLERVRVLVEDLLPPYPPPA
jgi:hypothetical protein